MASTPQSAPNGVEMLAIKMQTYLNIVAGRMLQSPDLVFVDEKARIRDSAIRYVRFLVHLDQDNRWRTKAPIVSLGRWNTSVSVYS